MVDPASTAHHDRLTFVLPGEVPGSGARVTSPVHASRNRRIVPADTVGEIAHRSPHATVGVAPLTDEDELRDRDRDDSSLDQLTDLVNDLSARQNGPQTRRRGP